MDLPDILKIMIFKDLSEIMKKRPQDPRDLHLHFLTDFDHFLTDFDIC